MTRPRTASGTGPAERLGEFELIARLFAPLSRGARNAFALTDDVALVDPSPGHTLVAKTDAIIAGVHFRPGDPPETVGRKALRVNLSDLAAKGARPLGFLQALMLNDGIDDAYLAAYARGLADDVMEFAVPLLGGDTTQSPGPFTIAVTALGEVPHGTALLRAGAKPGDLVYVSGTIGDAALALAAFRNEIALPELQTASLIARYHIPQPRLAAGWSLRGIASASLDVSDGLVADLGHLAQSSSVAVTVRRDQVPLSPAARAAVQQDPARWETILTGGDDYEIAFTAPAERTDEIAAAAECTNTALTVIGEVKAGPSGQVTVLDDRGEAMAFAAGGYQHR